MTTEPGASSQDTDPRVTLLRLEESLTTELAAAHAAVLEIRKLREDRSDDDEHDPEGVPLSGELSRLVGSYHAAKERVQHVQDALDNLDAGRYGVCVRCGGPITPGRLEALPTATRCVLCADQR